MPPNAALKNGKTYRNPRFPGDAGHALDAREAHGAGRAREALDATGAVGTLDALGAQLPSTASLEGTRRRRVGREQWGQRRPRPPPARSPAGPPASPLDFVVGMAGSRLPLLWVRPGHRDPAREQVFDMLLGGSPSRRAIWGGRGPAPKPPRGCLRPSGGHCAPGTLCVSLGSCSTHSRLCDLFSLSVCGICSVRFLTHVYLASCFLLIT